MTVNLATKISLDFMAQTGPGWWELRCEDHIQSQAQGLPGQLAKIRSQKITGKSIGGCEPRVQCLPRMHEGAIPSNEKQFYCVLLEMLQTSWNTQDWWKHVCLVPL